ncbi:sialidase family protein [Cytophagales bacterium LB-30]|uniref:Sialidase family protein n=1 Tax=Shiella aurantiaca TaxID=3058365 RepID=A0ABT8F4H3_9BACT|nr:sialidase family protein [Shiella aurantiaca]MDN4165360.1 sialidase family protein [Shiella aurantiaca]
MRQLAFFLLIVSLWSCSAKNEDLLLRSGFTSLGNRNYDKYTTGNGIIATTGGPRTAIGFGGNHFFFTFDNFDFVTDYQGQFPGENYSIPFIASDLDSMVAWTGDDSGFRFFVSRDFFINRLLINTIDDQFTGLDFSGRYEGWEYVSFSLLNGLVAGNYVGESGARPNQIDIYAMVDGASSRITSLTPGYVAVDMFTNNSNVTWLLAHSEGNPADMYVFISEDEGFTWTEPIAVSNGGGELIQIVGLSAERMIAYGASHIYRSDNGGQTWNASGYSFLASGETVDDITYANEGIHLFAVKNKDTDDYGTISDLYRSDDLGQSWVKVNSHDFYADYVRFHSLTYGIAVSNNVLQSTVDGGTTWQVIMFPFAN